MGFLHDAIMESNELEIDSLITKLDMKPTKPEKIEEEQCGSEQPQEELEEQLVDIEEYLPDEAYIQESVQLKEETRTLPDRYMKGRPGSPEYSANEKRREREAQYRKLANIDKDFEITADNINRWAFNRVCSDFRCDPERFKAELLKQPYTGLERYEED